MRILSLKISQFFVGLSLLLILPACGTARDAQPQTDPVLTQTYVFTCGNKFNFIARIEGNRAWLFLPGETVETFKVNDNLYRSLEASLRLEGELARIDTSQGNYDNCRNNRRLAIWEHAKLGGADFRATGNEPGWNLEIREQSKLILVTDYGSSRLEFDLPDPETDASARTTRYKIDQTGQKLMVTISGEPCSDSMSGETFESSVEVVINGKVLRGCGRALH